MKSYEVKLLLLNVVIVLTAWATGCMNRTNTLLCFIAVGVYYLLTVICRVLREVKSLNKALKNNGFEYTDGDCGVIRFSPNDTGYEKND